MDATRSARSDGRHWALTLVGQTVRSFTDTGTGEDLALVVKEAMKGDASEVILALMEVGAMMAMEVWAAEEGVCLEHEADDITPEQVEDILEVVEAYRLGA